MMKTLLTAGSWLLVLLLLLAGPGRAHPRPADAPALDGLWQGPLQLPGGKLDVIFRLVKLSSGEYFATLDVPLQKVHNLTVVVTAEGSTVTLASAEANCHFTGTLAADGQQLAGTWHQPGFEVPLTLTHTQPAEPVAAAAKPRLAPPYRQEDVQFGNLPAKLQLAGTLTVPAGQGPFPALVLLSDAGPHDRNGTVGDFAPLGQLADYLTRRGVAVLRFDDRGTGQSTGAPLATTAELVGDAQAALNFLRTRPEIDLQHLGLLGHGEGGNVALLAATGSLPPAFVVGLAPYGLTGAEIAVQQQEATLKSLQTAPAQVAAAGKRQQSMFEIIRQTPDNAQAQAIVANMLHQSNPSLDEATAQTSAAEMVTDRYRYYLSFNPAEELPKITCPVLLLYGSADSILNPDNNLAPLTRSLKANKAVTVRKLAGVNHLFEADPSQWPIVVGQQVPTFSPAAQDAVRAWVLEQAKK